MNRQIRKILTIMIALVLLFAVITGCSNQSLSSSTTIGSSSTTQTSGAVTTASSSAASLPLVRKPLTLNAAVYLNTFCPWDESLVLKKLQQETGITLKFKIYSAPEQVSLMYSSRDFPDISFGLSADKAKAEAIDAGDVLKLDDYMKYAPNITTFFSKYPEIKTQVTYKNGSLYAFPYAFLDEVSYGIRDIWLINRTWLDELKLSIPKTSEDFLNVMRAFRDNAGKGTIPQNVIPYYLRYCDGAIGGIFDVVSSFGIYVYDSTYGIVDNGKYIFQATNPDLKAPIKYLAKMYTEKLIPVSMFTDDSAAYYSVVNSNPPIAGSVNGYHNGNNYTQGGWFYPMAPFQTDSGKKPFTRTQAKGSQVPLSYMIYKNCSDPVAAVKLANYMASPEISMQMQWGQEGSAWKTNSAGKPELISTWVRDVKESGPFNGPDNMGFAMLSSDSYVNPAIQLEGHRAWAIYNIYKNYLPNPTYTYPKLPANTLNEKDTMELSDLTQDIQTYVKTTIGNWIAGKGNIDTEWDAYVQAINKLGLTRYLELQQKILDTAKALSK